MIIDVLPRMRALLFVRGDDDVAGRGAIHLLGDVGLGHHLLLVGRGIGGAVRRLLVRGELIPTRGIGSAVLRLLVRGELIPTRGIAGAILRLLVGVTVHSLQVGQDGAVHRDEVWVILDQVRDDDLVDALGVDLPLGQKCSSLKGASCWSSS